MVCSAVGKISFIDKPLMKYRIHSSNAIGFIEQHNKFMKRLSLFIKDTLKYAATNKKYRNLLYFKNIQQMLNICDHLSANVSKRAIAFSAIDRSNYFSRKMKNIIAPYIVERSLLKQITYVVCF